MLNRDDLDKIKKEVENFFKKMTIDIESDSLEQKEETVFIDIRVREPQVLIGEKGQTLLDLQHLLSAMLRKKIESRFFLDLDVNDYKKKKMEYLKELAKSFADEVALSRKEKILPAMPAYERRIIHMELAARGNVTTESVGKEPDRRLVIKPYP
jgi:spoIIIJ-associated protein